MAEENRPSTLAKLPRSSFGRYASSLLAQSLAHASGRNLFSIFSSMLVGGFLHLSHITASSLLSSLSYSAPLTTHFVRPVRFASQKSSDSNFPLT